jgi:hypothetical protein
MTMKPIFKTFKSSKNFNFVFFEIQGLFKVHEYFMTCKCGAMYMVFKIKLQLIIQEIKT